MRNVVGVGMGASMAAVVGFLGAPVWATFAFGFVATWLILDTFDA